MRYSLQQLATRARDWQAIVPPASQAVALGYIYNQIITAWQSASADLMPAYVAALDSGSVADLAAQEESHAAEIAALIAMLGFYRHFSQVEVWHRAKWLASVSRSAGVSVDMLLERPSGAVVTANRAARRTASRAVVNAARTAVRVQQGTLVANPALAGVDAVLANAVASNVSLVRSVSDQTRARIANAVFNGVSAGTPAEDVAREIRKGLNISRKRALRIAKNETVQAVKALNKFRITEAGFETATWVHLDGQLNPRPTHRARNGNEYRLDDPVFREFGLPNCHCTFGPPPLLVRGRGNAAVSRTP